MKESISLGFHTPDRCPTEADCPGFADAAAAFMSACQCMSMKLLSCFAVGLGFPEDFFSQVNVKAFAHDGGVIIMQHVTSLLSHVTTLLSLGACCMLRHLMLLYHLCMHCSLFGLRVIFVIMTHKIQLMTSADTVCSDSVMHQQPSRFVMQHHDVAKTDSQQTMRCLHYHDTSQQKVPANYWRAGAHTDFDTLTLLFQRPGSLFCCACMMTMSCMQLTSM